MKFEIKNPMLFIAKIEQILKLLRHAKVSFSESKVLFVGMNSDNTLLVSLELNEKVLVSYKFARTADYAFNMFAFLLAVGEDATSLKLEFKAGTLTITTNNGKAAISTIKLKHSEEQELDFDATFDISPYLSLFKEFRIKAKAVFPIQLEGDIGEGMMLKVIVAPKEVS